MQTEIFVSLGIAYLLCSEGNIENMCYHTRVCVPGHTSYFQDLKGHWSSGPEALILF